MNTEVKILLGIILFAAAIIIFSVLDANNSIGNIYPNGSQPISLRSSVKILSSNMTKDDDGNFFVTGTIQNIGNATLNYTEIKVDFNDKVGNLMTQSPVHTANLRANETWDFTVKYDGQEAYDIGSYDVSVGNVW